MNGYKYVLFLLVSAVTASGLMLAYMSRKSLCIDSRYVYQIDRLQSDKVVKAFRCTLAKPMEFDLEFYQLIPELGQRLQNVELILDLLGLRTNQVRISINTERPHLLRISNQHIYIGRDLLKIAGHLERAIIKIALLEKFAEVLAPDPVFVESLADFILYIANGELHMLEPASNKNLEITLQERWPLNARSYADQCMSPWKTSEQIAACMKLEQEKDWARDESLHQLDPWTFRSFYTANLVKSYERLSVGERLQFLRNFTDIIREVSLNGDSIATQAFVSFFDLAAQKMEALHEVYPSIRDKVEDITKMRFKLDFLFLTTVTADYLKELTEAFEEADLLEHQNVGVSDSKKLWVLPQVNGLNIGTARELAVRQLVIEICEPLNNESLMAYSKFAQRLLLVRRCENSKPINYVSLVEGGIQKFAMNNKQLSFVQIHLGSLSMVLSKGIENIDFFKILSGQTWSHQLFKQIGWQNPRWSESTRTYKATANVDAIESYRPMSVQ